MTLMILQIMTLMYQHRLKQAHGEESQVHEEGEGEFLAEVVEEAVEEAVGEAVGEVEVDRFTEKVAVEVVDVEQPQIRKPKA